jgi:hypothetical protein
MLPLDMLLTAAQTIQLLNFTQALEGLIHFFAHYSILCGSSVMFRK